ncbi:MAG: DUF1800 domain-containing protein [Candidatus Dadabacteria bacterium]
MDRRDFLTAQRKKIQRATPAFRTQSGINAYTGPWTTNEVQHLLKRTMFGSRKTDMNYFASKSMSAAVDGILNPTAPPPPPPLNDYNSATIIDPAVAPGTTWVNAPTNDGTINSARRSSFKKWWTGVMLNQDRSIREKLTLFWANHFGTETTDIGNANYAYAHHALLRANALGNFKSLVKMVTIDAGMLRYLNGYLNTNTAPDENYGRELQELFTIGKDPVTNLAPYTEDDVKKAAKVLTGWRINGATFSSYFDPTKHDSTTKTFSSFYGGTSIAGRSGSAGAVETDDLLNMIFSKQEVSKFIVRKLYRWFVYYKIDDATEANVISPLADLFRSSGYEVKPVLSTLFKSEHFFDVANQGCMIKSPVDQVISCMREFNVIFPDAAVDYATAYGMWNYLYSTMSNMGQNIGDPPNVSGWPAYYQLPMFHELWINSDTYPKRNRFTDTMINTGYTRSGKKIIIDAVAFAKTLSKPSDPNILLDDILNIIYRVPLSATVKQTTKQQLLLSNQVSDHYWTDAWNNYLNTPSDVANYNTVNTRLKSLLQYLMALAEYQLS